MSQQRPSFLHGDSKSASEKDKDSSLHKTAETPRPFSFLHGTTGTTGSTPGSGLSAGSGRTESPFRSSLGSQPGGSSLGSGSGSALSSSLRSTTGLGGSSFGHSAGSGQTGSLSSGLSSAQRSSVFSRPASPAGTGAGTSSFGHSTGSGQTSSFSSGLGTSSSPFRSSTLGQQGAAGTAGTGGLRSSLSSLSRPGQDASARPASALSSPFKPAGQTTTSTPATSSFRTQSSLGGLRTPSPTSAFRPAPGSSLLSGTSTPFRKDLQISDEEFLQLRDFIYQVCGIFIAENRKYLVENRLSNRIKELNLKSYSEYYNFLRFDNSRKEELNRLFEVVTTNETSFFRNPPQLKVFQDYVLKEVIDECRKTGRKRLRIWSAGCSTGEEPYTLAIILYEVLKSEIRSWDIKITANDLSEAVLAAARRGIYNEYALRTTPPEIIATYFTKDGNVYKIKPELKQLVSFGQINLSDKEQLRRVEKSQIVFCRNVIIYFDDEMKRKVISAFYDNLEPNGMLLIGHSESLHNISRAFKPEHHTGTIVYRKMG